MSFSLSSKLMRLGGFCFGSSGLLLGGCGIGSVATSGSGSIATPMVMAGNVHGGQQPVSHSLVQLYLSGAAGYGTGSTTPAARSITETGSGRFSFVKLTSGGGTGNDNTWSCPTDGSDPLVYLVSIGGNPNGTSDTAGDNYYIYLGTVLGRCSQVTTSTFAVINEITTAAMATAFAPYIDPETYLIGSKGAPQLSGTSSQGAIGLLNAFASFTNLVNIASGGTIPSTSYAGTGTAAGVTVTATPESAKLITMGNILAACVNSTLTSGVSATCETMLSAATPPVYPARTSFPTKTFAKIGYTFEAALYMALNPSNAGTFTPCGGTATTNTQCLFNLVPGLPAFGGGLTAAPADWTVGINYTSSGTCNGGTFFNGVAKEAVDASGNVWFINGTGNANTVLGAISPSGQPIYCYATATSKSGRGLSIDPSGNVWGSFNVAGGLIEIQGGATAVAWSTTNAPYSIVADPWGNVAFTQISSGGNFYQAIAPGTGTTGSTSTATWVQVGTNVTGTGTSASLLYTAADNLGRLWGTNISTGLTTILSGAIPVTIAVDSVTVAGGLATFSTPNGNSLTIGKKVAFNGLSSTVGKPLNYTEATVTAATGVSFTVAVSAADAGLATETGSVFVPGSTYTAVNTTPATTAPIYGLTTDTQGGVYTGSTCCSSGAPYRSFYRTTYSGTTFSTAASDPFLAGVNGSRSLTMDGASNLWAGFELPNDPTNSIYSVGEFFTTTTGGATTFTNISPNGAQSSCGTSSCTTGGGYFKTGMLEPFDLAVDPSGSVWVLNSSTATTVAAASYTGNSITQIVGAAVPVITPISMASRSTSLDMKP